MCCAFAYQPNEGMNETCATTIEQLEKPNPCGSPASPVSMNKFLHPQLHGSEITKTWHGLTLRRKIKVSDVRSLISGYFFGVILQGVFLAAEYFAG